MKCAVEVLGGLRLAVELRWIASALKGEIFDDVRWLEVVVVIIKIILWLQVWDTSCYDY